MRLRTTWWVKLLTKCTLLLIRTSKFWVHRQNCRTITATRWITRDKALLERKSPLSCSNTTWLHRYLSQTQWTSQKRRTIKLTSLINWSTTKSLSSLHPPWVRFNWRWTRSILFLMKTLSTYFGSRPRKRSSPNWYLNSSRSFGPKLKPAIKNLCSRTSNKLEKATRARLRNLNLKLKVSRLC